MTAAPRDLDIVLFGATGFTGRLTAAHVAAHAPAGVRIGLAGRSLERLEAVRTDLGWAAADWPLLVVDALDEDAVADLAARARVVATTVGPYGTVGAPLAAACARAGTHYCDLAGELTFVHRSIEANHEPAQRSGARIIHSCGFDSVPSDLGVLLCADAARADGAELVRTRLAVRSLKGLPSGGTVETARIQAIELRADPSARRIVGDPWALAEGGRPARPSGSPRAPRRAGVRGALDRVTAMSPVRRDPDTGHFTGPFFMASFNTRIVARSASLLGYGEGFRHSEHSDYGSGARGAVTAGVLSAGMLAGVAAMSFAPTRSVLDRFLPAPGEGPTEEEMAEGRFRFEVTAEATNGARYRATVAAPYDPGYSGTAIMLGQAALALAEEDAGLPDAAGVLTPATGIGAPLAERLRAHGFTLAVERLGQ